MADEKSPRTDRASIISLPPAPSPNVGLFPSDFQKKNRNTFWFAWLGFGLSLSMLLFDCSPYISLLTGFSLFLLWALQNINKGKIIWELLYFSADVFFREVGCRGEHRVPVSGPVIFACGPHSNQYCDGIVVSSVCRRQDIGLVIAEVTLRKKGGVGFMASALDPIGVERPQDVAVAGPGTVQVRFNDVRGNGTNFSPEDVGKTLMIRGAGSARIVQVSSPTAAVIANSWVNDDEWSHDTKYLLAPHMETESFYTNAFNRLREGHIVAMFPEGGSHDQTKMIGLKPGVAVVALMASKRLKQSIPVVPVGLTYFQGHRFRSRAFVDFGDPIYVTQKEIENYSSGPAGKRNEVSNLMKRIETALRSVVVQTDSYKELQLFWALRRLYTPTTKRLTADEKQSLNKRFVEGYEKVRNIPRVKDLVMAVNLYTTKLKEYGLHDYMVANRLGSLTSIQESSELYSVLIWTFASRILFLILSGLCWIPSGILAIPFVVLARYISHKKAQEAAKNSTVKISGRDVLATWKVLIAILFLPVLHTFYTLIVFKFVDHRWACVFFFFMPIVSIMNFKTQENIVRLARSLRPLFLFIRGTDKAKALVEMRAWCEREVCECVEEFKWCSDGQSSDDSPTRAVMEKS